MILRPLLRLIRALTLSKPLSRPHADGRFKVRAQPDHEFLANAMTWIEANNIENFRVRRVRELPIERYDVWDHYTEFDFGDEIDAQAFLLTFGGDA